MRVVVIFGTRPEAIKLAPVVRALRGAPGIECRVCVTGQHRQMLDQVLAVFAITPDVDLNLMEPNQTLARLTARAIKAIGRYIAVDQPDLVLVQSDTTSVFCAALAAFYHRIPLGHVEASLRTAESPGPMARGGPPRSDDAFGRPALRADRDGPLESSASVTWSLASYNL